VPRWLRPATCLHAALVLALLVLAVIGLLLHKEARQLERQALDEAALYARVLAEHVNRSLDATEAAMRAALDSSARIARSDSAALANLLDGSIRALPNVRSISLLDEQGRIYASSNPTQIGLTPPAQLFGTAAVIGRSALGPRAAGRDLADMAQAAAGSRHSFLPMVLKEAQPAGRRVLVTLNPDHLATAFDLLLKGTPYAGSLLQFDAQLLSTTLEEDVPPSRRLAELPAFTRFLPRLESGSYLAEGLSGRPAANAFRGVRLASWIVLVEREQASIDQDFMQTLRRGLAVAALLLLLIGGGALLGYRGLQAYAAVQQARQRAFLDLQQQLELNARLIEANLAPIYVTDQQGRLLKANRAWFELTGLSPERALGLGLRQELADLDPQAPQCPDAELLRAGGNVVFEATLRTPQGDAREVVVSKAAYRDGNGQLAGLVGSLSDVTAYQEARRAAEQASEAKTEFMANMSHELRTPLQSILGYAELGKGRFTEPPQVPLMFTRIHDASQRMLALVNNLLDLARSDLLSSRLVVRAQQPLPLMTEVTHELEALAAQRGQHIELHSPCPDCELQLDPQAFQQVVRNLLANALRFAPAGGRIELQLLSDEDGGHRLLVMDRGPGIPDDELSTIFEPFQQSSRTKDGSGGSGLGLAICRRLLQALGASISARNREGGGACFEVRFPPPATTRPRAA